MPRAQAQGAGFPVSGSAERTGFSNRLWPRHLLVGVLVVTILAGFGLMALSRTEPAAEPPAAPVTSRLVENRTMAELGSLPGFQRRGNSVVGEVCTRCNAGAPTRGRSHTTATTNNSARGASRYA